MNSTVKDLRGVGLVIATSAGAIGPLIAAKALDRGADVALVGHLDSEELGSLQDPGSGHAPAPTFLADRPARFSYLPLDTGNEDEIDMCLDEAFESLPRLSAFINVVRPFRGQDRKRIGDISLAEWNLVLEPHVRSPFLLTRSILDALLSRGAHGRIVHVMPSPEGAESGLGPYVAAQGALAALIRTVAKEYGSRSIACNGVAIGAGSPLDPAVRQVDDLPESHPYRRRLIAAAEAALFLASEEASYVNGEVLRVADLAQLPRGKDAGLLIGRIS